MEKLFFFCAIFGSVFVVLQFVMSLFGMDGNVDADGSFDDGALGDVDGDGFADAQHHVDSNGSLFLRAFTFKTVTAGVAFFGLAGMACRSAGWSVSAQLGAASACGLVAVYAVYFMIRALSSFNHNGSIKTASAVGATGSVYLTIPGARQGRGKVTIVQQERSMEYDAVTDAKEPLQNGAPIVVLEVLNDSLLLVASCNNGVAAPSLDK